jgi:hypothetical protein
MLYMTYDFQMPTFIMEQRLDFFRCVNIKYIYRTVVAAAGNNGSVFCKHAFLYVLSCRRDSKRS